MIKCLGRNALANRLDVKVARGIEGMHNTRPTLAARPRREALLNYFMGFASMVGPLTC